MWYLWINPTRPHAHVERRLRVPNDPPVHAAKARLAAFLRDLESAKPRRQWEDLPDDERVLTEWAELWAAFGEELHTRARQGSR